MYEPSPISSARGRIRATTEMLMLVVLCWGGESSAKVRVPRVVISGGTAYRRVSAVVGVVGTRFFSILMEVGETEGDWGEYYDRRQEQNAKRASEVTATLGRLYGAGRPPRTAWKVGGAAVFYRKIFGL